MKLRKDACMSDGWFRPWAPNTSGAEDTQPMCEIGVLERRFDRDWSYFLLWELLPDYYGQPLQDLTKLDHHPKLKRVH